MRDTDADWRAIAEHEPHYGVITNPQFLSANLTPEAVEAFYHGGVADMAFIVERLRSRWPAFAPRTAVDFGCGVGRLVFAMRAHAEQVTGVDIAPAMLDVARARAAETGAEGVAFGDTAPDVTDWVNSYIVFQHIPPRRGLPLLGSLIDRLAPGGFISLQVTLYRRADRLDELSVDAAHVAFDGERSRIIMEAPAPGAGMRMFDYDANAVLARLFEAGIAEVDLVRTEHGGHIGAWFFGRKPG